MPREGGNDSNARRTARRYSAALTSCGAPEHNWSISGRSEAHCRDRAAQCSRSYQTNLRNILVFAPPPLGLQCGGWHRGGSGCGLSATIVPMSAVASTSERPISACAAITPAASVAQAMRAKPSFDVPFMISSFGLISP
jgi:hypothetical protein